MMIKITIVNGSDDLVQDEYDSVQTSIKTEEDGIDQVEGQNTSFRSLN